MALAGLDAAQKGGPGSGFYGHSGRPGLVGGSAAGSSGKPAGTAQSSDDETRPITVGYNVSDAAIRAAFGERWQSFAGTAYRGPNKRRVPGRQYPNVYGDGRYYALDEEGARSWTDTPQAYQVTLDNPLRLTTRQQDETFRAFVGRDTGIAVKYPWPLTRLQERAMTAWLRDQGYDGIVVDYHGAPGARQVIVLPTS